MAATWLYRIAAIVFVLFALGHTYGFLSLRPPSEEARAVYAAMNTVHFVVNGRSYTYGGFYRGFGLSCTASMIFSAFLSWHLAGLARSNRRPLERWAGCFLDSRWQALRSASFTSVRRPWCYPQSSPSFWDAQRGWRTGKFVECVERVAATRTSLHKSMTTSRTGCEQQMRRLPSAGFSSGSGP